MATQLEMQPYVTMNLCKFYYEKFYGFYVCTAVEFCDIGSPCDQLPMTVRVAVTWYIFIMSNQS